MFVLFHVDDSLLEKLKQMLKDCEQLLPKKAQSDWRLRKHNEENNWAAIRDELVMLYKNTLTPNHGKCDTETCVNEATVQ